MGHPRPNILFIMSDDHAAHAMSCYGSRVNKTPNLDRLAEGGMRLDNCFCTNGICTPSRATILTGTYNHVNGCTTLATHWDNRQQAVSKVLQANGYQTAMIGKWHLGTGPDHCPTGFDFWSVLPGQGLYHDPVMHEMGEKKTFEGYVTDIITDKCINWLDQRDKDRPFFLMYHHKAPHRSWESDDAHANLYEDVEIPEPPTFHDDHSGHATAARVARMRIDRDMKPEDTDGMPPGELDMLGRKKWRYQRYMKKYLRCVASIDDNVGRMLDYLDAEGLTNDTVVIYTSDQGFFLGDHGWYDKRFMYEESLRMPFVIRYPREIEPGTVTKDFALNVDFAPLFLDYAGIPCPPEFQGRSFRSVLRGDTPPDWQKSMYYRYWMNADNIHNVFAHYGVRTHRYKLICYYADGLGHRLCEGKSFPVEWELFDLEKDPMELQSVYDDPAYQEVVKELKAELARLQNQVGDEPYPEAVEDSATVIGQ